MTSFAEAKRAIDPIIEYAKKSSDKRRLAQLYQIIGNYDSLSLENFEDGLRNLSNAIEISAQLRDLPSSIMPNYWYSVSLGLNCQFEKSISYHKVSIDTSMAANNRWGSVPMRSSLSLFNNYASMISAGYSASSEALSIAEKTGHAYSKGMAHTSHGFSHLCKGNLHEAIELLLKGLDFCERAKIVTWISQAHDWLGETYYFLGEHEQSTYHYDQSIRNYENAQIWPSQVRLNKAYVMRTRAIMKERNIDLAVLRESVSKNKIKRLDAYIRRATAEALLSFTDGRHLTEAERWLQQALETDTKHCTHWGAAQDYVLYAELEKKKGNAQRARESLGKAIENFVECGADGWVKRTEEKLAQS
jgi:tetratricopeptide (TPR) repeat protein